MLFVGDSVTIGHNEYIIAQIDHTKNICYCYNVTSTGSYLLESKDFCLTKIGHNSALAKQVLQRYFNAKLFYENKKMSFAEKLFLENSAKHVKATSDYEELNKILPKMSKRAKALFADDIERKKISYETMKKLYPEIKKQYNSSLKKYNDFLKQVQTTLDNV